MRSPVEQRDFLAWHQHVKAVPMLGHVRMSCRTYPAEGSPGLPVTGKPGALVLEPGGVVFLRGRHMLMPGILLAVAGPLLVLVVALAIVLSRPDGTEVLDEFAVTIGIFAVFPVVVGLFLALSGRVDVYSEAAVLKPAVDPNSLFIPLHRLRGVEKGPDGLIRRPGFCLLYLDGEGRAMRAAFRDERFVPQASEVDEFQFALEGLLAQARAVASGVGRPVPPPLPRVNG